MEQTQKQEQRCEMCGTVLNEETGAVLYVRETRHVEEVLCCRCVVLIEAGEAE